jgi:GT2 family glycosyltransferase
LRIIHVFVIHWNAPEWCRETVQSLLASYGVEVRVTVVDNGSERIPALPPNVVLERQPTNRGYAGAANRAIALADDEGMPLFAIASHDVVVSPESLNEMLKIAERHPRVGIIGPNFGIDTVANGWLSGSLLMLRLSCAREVGQFDELFGSYCEEVDFCHRATRQGWQLAIAEHAPATTHGTKHEDRARLLMDANFTLLAAKEGDWARVALRLAGMGRRSISDPRGRWARSLVLSLRQLARYGSRTLRERIASAAASRTRPTHY